MKRITLILLLPVTLMLPLLAAGCGDEASSESNDSSEAILQLTERVRRDEMMFAAVTIANLPIHDLDTGVQNGTIGGEYVPTARTVIRITALTDWAPELREQAQQMHDNAVALFEALDAGADVEEIKPLSQAVHEDWHMFPNDAWDFLAKDLPQGGDPHDSDEHSSDHGGEENADEMPMDQDDGEPEAPMDH